MSQDLCQFTPWVFAAFFSTLFFSPSFAYFGLIVWIGFHYRYELRQIIMKRARRAAVIISLTSIPVAVLSALVLPKYGNLEALKLIQVGMLQTFLVGGLLALSQSRCLAVSHEVRLQRRSVCSWARVLSWLPFIALGAIFHFAADVSHVSQNQISITTTVLLVSCFGERDKLSGILISLMLAATCESLLLLLASGAILWQKNKSIATIAGTVVVAFYADQLISRFIGPAAFERERYFFSESAVLNGMNLLSKGRVQRISEAWSKNQIDPVEKPVEIDILDILMSLALPEAVVILGVGLAFFFLVTAALPNAYKFLLFIAFFLLGHAQSSWPAVLAAFACWRNNVSRNKCKHEVI